jgi:hypothetical protein
MLKSKEKLVNDHVLQLEVRSRFDIGLIAVLQGSVSDMYYLLSVNTQLSRSAGYGKYSTFVCDKLKQYGEKSRISGEKCM